MTTGSKALLGLAAGLTAGAAIAASGRPELAPVASVADIVGTLWINAILMTIIPLVVSKLVVSIAGQTEIGAIGRAGSRAAVTFLALLTAAAAGTALVMPTVFSYLPIDDAAAAALRSGVGAAGTPAAPVPAGQWILSLIPSNAFRAAADNAIVPVLVFTIAFAIGARRVSRELRDPLVQLFRAVDAAITVLLHWIVDLSPVGVFALGLALAARAGGGIVVALGYYIVVSSSAMVLATAVLYVVVHLVAGVSPLRFARAAAPAQVVAFGTHSSMASLPAMLEGAERRLGLSQTATGFVLPLSLAVFKYSGPVWFVVVTFFVGRL